MPNLTDPAGRPTSGVVGGGVIAIVEDINDPNKLGRVRVKYPHLQGVPKSWWLRVATPHAGKLQGLWSLPDVGDEVLVMFLQGSQDEGIIISTLWNGKDTPPTEALGSKIPPDPGGPKGWAGGWPAPGESKHEVGGKLQRYAWRSREGHLFMMDDSKGKESVYLMDKGRKLAISFDTKEGKIYIVNADKDIVIRAKQHIIIEAEKDIKIKANQNIQVESTKETKFKAGTDWKVDAGKNIDMKAATNVAQKAGSNFEAKAGANMTLDGNAGFKANSPATSTLQGGATAVVKGGMVTIN